MMVLEVMTSGSSSETEEYMSINSSPNKSPPKRSEFKKILHWFSAGAQSPGGIFEALVVVVAVAVIV